MSADVQVRPFLLPPPAPAPVVSVDSADQKVVLYPCGTHNPGRVRDPCQHSTMYVRCCTCAGCMFDLWSCGQPPAYDGYLWWEAQKLGMRFDPWVRHPYALILYALVIIFALASRIIETVLEIFFVMSLLGVGAISYALSQLL